jgi:hypothetical protein
MAQTNSPQTGAKRFLWTWLLVLVLLGVVVFPGVTLFTLEFFDSSEAHWVDQLYARKLRAIELRRTPADRPMLLTFGSSTGLFGVDAQLFEQRLGIPSVNFNTHGALGFDYHLARLRRTARRGDTALLVLDTSTVLQDPAISHDLLKHTVWTYDRAYLSEMSSRRLLEFLYLNRFGDYGNSFKNRQRRKRGERLLSARAAGGYGYLQLSPNGDFSGSPAAANFVSSTHRSAVVHPRARTALQQVAQWCQKNGVHLRIAVAPVCRPEPADVTRRNQQYAAMDTLLQELGLEVWSRAAESEYPREWFIDTAQHLTPAGRRIYTERLIETRHRLTGLPPPPQSLMFLLHGRNGEVSRPPTEENPPPAVKSYYVSPTPLPHPDCIAVADLPSRLRAALQAGTPVRFSNPALAPIVSAAGFSATEAAPREATLTDWHRRYPEGIFLLAMVGPGRPPFPLENLPSPLRAALEGESFRAAVVGPGLLHRSTGTTPLSVHLAATSAHPFAFDILLRSSPPESFRPGDSPVRVNDEPLGLAEPGLAVAVLDPAAGIIVAKGTFTSERIIESRLFNVTAP